MAKKRDDAANIAHSPARQFAQYLIDQGVAVAPTGGDNTWPVIVGERDKRTIQQLVVSDNDVGKTEGRSQRDGAVTTKPAISVFVYTAKQGPGFQKANELQAVIDGLRDAAVTIGDNTYTITSTHRQTGIMYLGRDKSDKMRIHSLRASVTTTQPTPAPAA